MTLEIDVQTIKALRDLTGAGIMDCKRALEETGADIEKAQALLREKGIASASSKSDRSTTQGIMEAYVHSGGRIGSLVEVNCETDFVARTQQFKDLAHDVAMQVAAMAPLYVDVEEVPEGVEVNPQEVCLLQQPYIKDPTRIVDDVVKEAIGKFGENVRVKRFVRFSLAE